MGAIKPLLAYDKGVVSSLYICFRIKDDVDADFHFFRHYLEAGLLNEEISGIAQEGARNHGLLNVGIGDFFKLRLHVPPPPLQRKIAEAINVAEAEERLFERQLERFQIEKRALMQQLLTGKRRVKVDQPAAEASAA
jgi:type I restriction enzyme S subunit